MTPAKSKVTPHLFRRDPQVPPDINGHGACAECHLIGQPGDTHHTLPEPVGDVRQLAAGDSDGGER
jgi:hypothetical protein